MPTYEYKCTICDDRFEVEQSITANTLKTIKGEDHRHTVKKVFHAPGIAFKGDGFYKNDARGKPKKSSESASDSSKDSSKDSSSDSSSTDSKKSDTTGTTDKTDKSGTTDKTAKADKPAKSDSAKKKEPAKSSSAD